MRENKQYTVATKVRAVFEKETTKEKLEDLLDDLIWSEQSTNDAVVIEGIRFTASFVKENQIVLILQALPVDMVDDNVYPMEARVAVVNIVDEKLGRTIEDLTDDDLDERVDFLLQKMKADLESLTSDMGLFPMSFVPEHATIAHETTPIVTRSKTLLFSANGVQAAFRYYVMVDPYFSRAYGLGFQVTLKVHAVADMLVRITCEVRTRSGVVLLDVPSIRLKPDEVELITADKDKIGEVIARYFNAAAVERLLGCVTMNMLNTITTIYQRYWSALKQDAGRDNALKASGTRTDWIEITDTMNRVVYRFLPTYSVKLLENEQHRSCAGVRFDPDVTPPFELTHTKELIQVTWS